MDDWKGRVIAEKTELSRRIEALEAFMDSPVFDALVQPDRHLLIEQHKHMAAYANALQQRIDRFSL